MGWNFFLGESTHVVNIHYILAHWTNGKELFTANSVYLKSHFGKKFGRVKIVVVVIVF